MNSQLEDKPQQESQYAVRPHHRMERPKRDRYFKTRNILNLLFVLGAIAGLLVYFYANHNAGIIIILVSMVFKVIECCLRLFRR